MNSTSMATAAPAAKPSGALRPIILFDGVCNLCNESVLFVIDRDPRATFDFASLQSDHARALLAEHGFSDTDVSTIVLVEAGKVYVRSTAALRIARRLSGPWPALYLALVIPRPIRDAGYRWIARNRYRWFGKLEACRIPAPEIAGRFLG
jgi:predicted DCC family thiol-disulfide oxidoreductase YuxK